MSLLNRTEDAIVYLAREEGDDVVTFAEATLRRDYVNGCSVPRWISRGGLRQAALS